jgi:penicillin-binding protein 1C
MLSHPNQKSFQTTIDPSLQKNASRILAMHMTTQQANNVHNCAALIVEIKTGKVLMYHGNSPITDDAHSRMVDIIHAPRSTGSILKPVLYAAMLQEGAILPETLIEDIPIQFNGFTPKNYFETYDGLVPASNALSRSLNIPAVVMLKDYGYPRFVNLLQRLGLKDIDQPADHYGLSVILGGAECNLWDLTKLYAGLGRTLHSHQINADHEWTDNYEFQTTLQNDHSVSYTSYSPLSPSAIWCTYQSLMAVNRPDTELGWEAYNSSQPIAWKTGTSFGNRDAWAIGSSSEYVVSVWVGNADGTGRPGLTGVQAAAPILFDLFKLLDLDESFIQPTNSLIQIETCSQSGMRKGPHCLDSKWQWAPVSGLRTNTCGYHQLLFLDPVSGHQVTSECFSPHLMISRSHFVVPPAHAHYFKNKNPEYQNAPPYLASCDPNSHPLDILYPRNGSSIFLPVGLNGQTIPIVLQATHLHDQQLIYWHLDNTYIGETKEIHQIEITPSEGQHQLVITDTAGHRSTVTFQVIKNNTK